MGFDLNRNWHQLNEWAHPSLYAFDQMVQDLDSTKAATVDFILDLHASVSLPGVFVYGNTYDDVYRYERHILFPKLLAQNTEDYLPENTMYNRDALKVGTARRFGRNLVRTLSDYYQAMGLIHEEMLHVAVKTTKKEKSKSGAKVVTK
ncbi:hypothetical protein RUM43_013707 [Polyplax serrata]|uniref:Peptidase M14 carboxypeptidase A domain-containing protein n=1 Tax=Polyplax serrata TaxID=468196 RepID=A0AAN8S739_POLSC